MRNRILILTLALSLILAISSCTPAVQHEHDFSGEWASDEAYHWHVCAGDDCDEIADKAEHTGGTATETEKAKCETCGAEYGELLAHTHAFGEWETKTPANCDDAEVEIRYCACGASETQTGDAALGHSYTEQVVSEDYLATANCGEQATYYYSCACGAAGEETFFTGDVIEHVYGEWQTKSAANCTDAEVEYRACACGAEETRTGDAALNHSMVNKSDEFEHWTECEREGCDEATEKVAHEPATLSVVSNLSSPMQYDVVKVSDLTVTAGCDCGVQIPVTRGIIFTEFALAEGTNTITVTFAGLTATTTVEAAKFGVVIDGKVTDDTHVYSGSGSQDKNYVDQKELSANGNNFRVLLRYNFSDFLASAYYQAHKTEAKVQFTFTMTTGTITTEDAITFKVYPTSADRSAVNFSSLTWKTYDDEPHALGWGNAYGFVEKVAKSDKVAIDGDKITITVAYRELEQFIDADGNAIFVFAIWKSSTKVGSIENDTVANRPTVQVIVNDEHIHAFNNEIVDEKYFVSANCTEKAKYFTSCSCGEAGTKIFEYGEAIEHAYSDWAETQAPTCTAEGVNTKICAKCGDAQTEAIPTLPHNYNAVVTAPTCTEAGYTTYTCSCGDSYVGDNVAASGHSYGDWQNDESYHWKACACGDIIEKATHFGGTATETEQASCEICGVKYGGLASHEHSYTAVVTAPTCTEAGYTTYTCDCGNVYTADEVAANGHSFSDWATQTPANCNDAEVEIRSCSVCGIEETQTGDAALGHNMETKHNDDSHWTECSRCDEATEAVAHFGGEATYTEQAICEECSQPYGALKEVPKQEYTISGAIAEDTYVSSNSTSAKDIDYSTSKDALGTYSNYYRAYFKFDLSSIINSEDYATCKGDAKIQFIFTLSKGAVTDSSKLTFGGFTPGANTTGLAFSNVTYNSVSSNGTYADLNWNSATTLVDGGKTVADNADKVSYTENTLTITLNYSDIEGMVDENGLVVFTLRIGSTSGISIASMENTTYAAPAVKFVYTK